MQQQNEPQQQSGSTTAVLVPVVTPMEINDDQTVHSNIDSNNSSSSNNNNPLCVYQRDYGRRLTESLSALRLRDGLVDLDIVCENGHVRAHKSVLAAASDFFRERLLKANVDAPVLVRLEDFGLKVKLSALKAVVEFVYRGEVVVASRDKLNELGQAAHSLGIIGLVEILPKPGVTTTTTTTAAPSTPRVTFISPSNENNEPVFPSSSSSVVNVHEEQQQQQQQQHHQQFHFPSSSTSDPCLAPAPAMEYSNQIHHVVVSLPQQQQQQQQQPPIFMTTSDQQQQQQHNYFPVSACDVEPQQQQQLPSTSSTQQQQQQQQQQQPQFFFDSSQQVGAMPDYMNDSVDDIMLQNDLPKSDLKANNSSNSNNKMTGKLRVISQGNLGAGEDSIPENIQTPNPTISFSGQQQQQHHLDAETEIPFEHDLESDEITISGQKPVTKKVNLDVRRRKEFSGDSMLAIRSGIPLALQRKQRKMRKSSSSPAASTSQQQQQQQQQPQRKKSDLGIRKDLTLPTAPSVSGANLFQSDEDESLIDITLDDDEDDEEPIEDLDQVQVVNVKEKKYQCVECTMTFITESELRNHSKAMHGSVQRSLSPGAALRVRKELDSSLACPVCEDGREMVNKEALKMHLFKSHGMGKIFRCEECGYETSNKTSYVRHMGEVHRLNEMGGLLRCEHCDKDFKSREGLKLHVKAHFASEHVQCTDCDFATVQKANLAKHMATKHCKSVDGTDLKEDFKCDLCPFKCVAEFQLKNHKLRKHTDRSRMRFKCTETECDYASVEKSALEKHIRFKHTNERPYVCGTCGFSTHTSSSMARHRQAHEGKKPHICGDCGAAYADKKRLRDHRVKVHQDGDGESGSFSCPMCDFHCRRKDNLKAHIKRLHGEEKTAVAQIHPNPDPPADKIQANKSHIVGHVNSDGSIRPVSSASTATTSISIAGGAKEVTHEKD